MINIAHINGNSKIIFFSYYGNKMYQHKWFLKIIVVKVIMLKIIKVINQQSLYNIGLVFLKKTLPKLVSNQQVY